MDPIVATIIWGVVWLFLGSIGSAVIFFVSTLTFAAFDKEAVGAVIGWLLAFVWQFFVVIQVILHIVRLIQLVVAGV